MAWVTTSLRNMQLKTRISNIQLRLMQLSQREQTLINNAQYAQRAMSAKHDLVTNIYNMGAAANMNMAIQSAGGSQEALMANITNANQAQMMGSMINESIYNTYKSAMDQQIKQVAATIQLEKDQLESQLKSAQAEQASISQSMDQEIKNSAIKLA